MQRNPVRDKTPEFIQCLAGRICTCWGGKPKRDAWRGKRRQVKNTTLRTHRDGVSYKLYKPAHKGEQGLRGVRGY